MTRDSNPDIGAYEYNSTLSITEKSIETVKISPNPFSEFIDITLKTPIKILKLYAIDGRQISILKRSHLINNNTHRINLSELQEGLYLLMVNNTVIKILKN